MYKFAKPQGAKDCCYAEVENAWNDVANFALSLLPLRTSIQRYQWLGGKRGAGAPGCGVPEYGVPGCGKRGVWKTRGVENAGRGKRGVRKRRGVKNAGSGGKRGVWWKTRGLSGKHGGNRIFLTKTRSLNFVFLNCNENQLKNLYDYYQKQDIILCNNKEILIGGKQCFWSDWFKNGIISIKDLLDETGNLLTFHAFSLK